MSVKSSLGLLILGGAVAAAGISYYSPTTREEIIKKLYDECGVSHDLNVSRPLQQPGFFDKFKQETPTKPSFVKTIQDSFSTKSPSESDMAFYCGNSWPDGWPIQNSDGSYNPNYIRWYENKNGRK